MAPRKAIMPQGAPLLTRLTLIPAWITNYIHYGMWDKITYPFPNFNTATTDEWFHPTIYLASDYLSTPGSWHYPAHVFCLYLTLKSLHNWHFTTQTLPVRCAPSLPQHVPCGYVMWCDVLNIDCGYGSQWLLRGNHTLLSGPPLIGVPPHKTTQVWTTQGWSNVHFVDRSRMILHKKKWF